MNPYRTDGRNTDHSDHYSYRADPIDRARADAIASKVPNADDPRVYAEYARLVRTDREYPCEGKNALIRWNYAKSTVADNEILPEPSDFEFDRRGDAQEARYELIGDDGRTYPILIRIESDTQTNPFEDCDGMGEFSDSRSSHDSIDQHEGEERGRSRGDTEADRPYWNMPKNAVRDSARFLRVHGMARHDSYLRADSMRFNELETARKWYNSHTYCYGIIVEVYEPGAIIDPGHAEYDGKPEPIAEESCWGFGPVDDPTLSRYIRSSMADLVRGALARAEEDSASALYAETPVCGAD